MDQEWGPWNELDGTAAPNVPDGAVFEVFFSGPGIKVPDHHVINVSSWPGFIWKWKTVRVGWFETKRQRVCEVPDYAPIIRIRIRKPPAQGVSRLAQIAAKPPGVWIKDPTDADPRLSKKAPA